MKHLLENWVRISVIVLLAASGCHAPGSDGAHRPSPNEPRKARKPMALQPVLGTNEVLRIAREAAEKIRFRLDGYTWESALFGYGALSNKWLVHFTRQPATADDEFFVIIDDRTKGAETYQP
jgi:hypothetical protein